MNNTPSELRVFISSTFRDLQGEREYLVKKIFPEIRALCRERGVEFTEIDLRWGLTDEEAVLGRVIRTCLEEIDRCRPYFLGLIGDRYGWAPEYHEIAMDPELLLKYPWIEEAALDGASVTEMEFVHGVFSAPETGGGYAWFYRRSKPRRESDDPDRLEALVERARATGRPMSDFETPESLGEMVRRDLLDLVERNWPVDGTLSELELVRRDHTAFALSRRRAYIASSDLIKQLNLFIASSTPVVIHAESGAGKSALVAFLVEQGRRRLPGAVVIEHYVGASETSGSHLGVMRHLMEELRERFGIDEALPSEPALIEQAFPRWLDRAGLLARREGVAVFVVIDALNQLNESGQHLSWLPRVIPPGISMVVSVTPGHSLDRLQERNWTMFEVVPINDERLRAGIVVRYLGEFRKSVSAAQLSRISSHPQASSPLFLRTVAEELRLHGEHTSLDVVLDRLMATTDLDGIFQCLLDRLEDDYGASVVRAMMASIAVSRSGLSESELRAIAVDSRLHLSYLIRALDYHLVRSNGRLNFFHDYLRRAVEARYLTDAAERQRTHIRLADYFTAQEPTPVVAREMVHHIHRAGDKERLVKAISSLPVVDALFATHARFELQVYWQELAGEYDIEEIYRGELKSFLQEPGEDRRKISAIRNTAILLEQIGRWSTAHELNKQALELAEAIDDRDQKAQIYCRIAEFLRLTGDYTGALDYHTREIALFEELGNSMGQAAAARNLGNLYYQRGDFTAALSFYQHALEIAKGINSRVYVSLSLGNIGNIHLHQGETDLALEHYRQQLDIAEELGERGSMAVVTGNIGVVFYLRREYDLAIEYFERQIAIAGELGERRSLSRAYGSLGNVHMVLGAFAQALEFFETSCAVSEEIGDLMMIVNNYEHIAGAMLAVGRFDESLTWIDRFDEAAGRLGNPIVDARAAGLRGTLYGECDMWEESIACFQKAVRICRESGQQQTEWEWSTRIGYILVHLAVESESAPPFLATLLPDLLPERWQSQLCAELRRIVEEYRNAAGREAFLRVDLLEIAADILEGERAGGLQRLRRLRDEATEKDAVSTLSHMLWQLSRYRSAPGDPEVERYRGEAREIHARLYAEHPRHIYRKILAELTDG